MNKQHGDVVKLLCLRCKCIHILFDSQKERLLSPVLQPVQRCNQAAVSV